MMRITKLVLIAFGYDPGVCMCEVMCQMAPLAYRHLRRVNKHHHYQTNSVLIE